MKTQYTTAASLDGYIATEDHSLEWLFPLADFKDTGFDAFLVETGAAAMGASTYEWMLKHVVDKGEPWPYAFPVWVFSHRALPLAVGADIRFVQGDVRPVHAAMCAAAEGRNVWIVGGGDLAGQLFDAALLDELIVFVGSVTLGKGQPLLPRRIAAPPLRLHTVRQIGPGMVELRYEVPARHG